MSDVLLDVNGDSVTIQQGESCNVVVTFQDHAGATIVKANLITLTATLYDQDAATIINSRNAVNVKDANDGVVATDGTLTWRLGPLDNVIVGTVAVGKIQDHVVRFTWEWSDGVATRKGIENRIIRVEKLAVPA